MNGWQAMFAANSAIRFLSANNGLPVLVIIAPTCFFFAVWKALSKPLASS
jgi:hypothetical protein